ncbi:nuclease-related domain-containing protein [Nitratifractor sp.]
MILKEADPKPILDKYAKAGMKAEKQMSFYLSRAFGDSEGFYVINDLRLEDEGEVAQIDSLVIHHYGFVLIESKSVTQKIKVNKYGEWTRIYNNQEKGMPSPIKQVERQIDFLRKYLNMYAKGLFSESFFNKIAKPSYDKYKFDMAIAISDEGIIYRDEFESDVIMKADMVPEYIMRLKHKYQKKRNSLLDIEGASIWGFRDETLEKVSKFLLNSHKRKNYQDVEKSSADIVSEPSKQYKKEQKSTNKIEKTCPKCGSSRLEILYGFSYYFKCRECGSNSKIVLTCNTDRCRPRIKKDGNRFYKVCETCGTNELYHINQ